MDVGKTPRKSSHAMPLGGATRHSRTSWGAYGRQKSAPTRQHVQVACNAAIRFSTGFSATIPIAEASAAARQRITPRSEPLRDDVATPIPTTPANARAPPHTAQRQTPERQRARGERTTGGPDADEGRGPEDDGDEGREERQMFRIHAQYDNCARALSDQCADAVAPIEISAPSRPNDCT